jgi:hypothetical protein
MDLVPIITTILLYTSGFLIIVVLFSNIVKKVFIVKTEIPQNQKELKVATKTETKHYDKSNKPKRAEESTKNTRVSESHGKAVATSVGEEYSRKERRKKKEKKQEVNEARSSRFVVINKNLRQEESPFVARYYPTNVKNVNWENNKINYRAE